MTPKILIMSVSHLSQLSHGKYVYNIARIINAKSSHTENKPT